MVLKTNESRSSQDFVSVLVYPVTAEVCVTHRTKAGNHGDIIPNSTGVAIVVDYLRREDQISYVGVTDVKGNPDVRHDEVKRGVIEIAPLTGIPAFNLVLKIETVLQACKEGGLSYCNVCAEDS